MRPLRHVQRRIPTVNFNGEDITIPDRIGRGGYKSLRDYDNAEMQKLGQLVLDNKKDIKYSESAAIYPRAGKFAKTKGLILGPYEDVNGDGNEDVILYDHKGNVRYINGYSLSPSTHRMKEKFHQDFPTKSARKSAGGWTEYRKSFLDREDAAAWLADPKQNNYFVPKPRRAGNSETLYKQFVSDVNGFINATIADVAGPKTHCKSLISSFTVASLAFINSVLRILWNLPANNTIKVGICAATPDPTARYERFKKAIASNVNKPIVMRQYTENRDAIAERANVAAVLEMLNLLDYNDDTVGEMPTDEELVIPPGLTPEEKAEARAHVQAAQVAKLQLKEHIAERVDGLKAHIISAIFGGQPGPGIDPRVVTVHSFIEMPPQAAQATINAMRERQPENYASIRAFMESQLEGNRDNEGFMRVWGMFA